MKYKKGDKVRITDCIHGHRFKIGEIVTIQNECSIDYGATNGESSWAITDDECELYLEESNIEKELKLEDLKEGMKVHLEVSDLKKEADGVIAIFGEYYYVLHDNHDLDGFSAPNKMGYKYSWELNYENEDKIRRDYIVTLLEEPTIEAKEKTPSLAAMHARMSILLNDLDKFEEKALKVKSEIEEVKEEIDKLNLKLKESYN